MKHIIDQLQSFSAASVFNPWSDIDPMDALGMHAAKARISRLEAHFNCRPSYLLIGEAPGYQGCHFSGVPFTNEKLILDGAVPRVKWNNRITTRRLPWSEPAATIMWRTLHHLGIAGSTVMWNAYAWHPHHGACISKCCSTCRPGDRYSNRTPTGAEVEAGLRILWDITAHFHEATVIAVGKVAARALAEISMPCESVRHPSMGGAREFAEGLERIVDAQAVAS
ncbi:MAG TPA: uracil-DNA glycosylase [Aquabacterium sp.]|nr:uracil-DNA glycosylase [Aquabacterium sp.]